MMMWCCGILFKTKSSFVKIIEQNKQNSLLSLFNFVEFLQKHEKDRMWRVVDSNVLYNLGFLFIFCSVNIGVHILISTGFR